MPPIFRLPAPALVAGLLSASLLVAPAAASPLAHMFGRAEYWPPYGCRAVCVLTGPGGIKNVWEAFVDRHPGATFVVEGVCASACHFAYRRALDNGERVVLAPGARLIPHAPGRMEFWCPGRRGQTC